MSTTFTTALSTPGVVVTNTNTTTTTNGTTTTSLRKRGGKTKLFFTLVYDYFAITFRFICSLIVLPSFKNNTKLITNNIPNTKKNNAAMQYYKNKTLILDLDETLVHSVRLGSEESLNNTKISPSITSKKIEVQCDKQSLLYQVYKRPHVDFFLKTISQWYKVVIYTASMAEYADPVIDWLDGENMISQRFFRQSCVVRNGNFLKDVTLAEKDLCKVCLVDNSPIAFDLFKENGITCPTWISNPNDESLLDLLPFLDALRFAADVRSILKLQHKLYK